MQALILAAGRGRRMGEKTAGLPKCLLEIGAKPLIEHQLEALAESGVGPVALVLGYCDDDVREVVGIRAEYIHNPRWRGTNSLYSFWLARDWVQGPVMVLNSDVLFDPKIVERLVSIGSDAIAFDSGSGCGAEAMKVVVEAGRLVSMGKNLPSEDTAGENVGILCFSEETAQALFERAGEIIEDGGERSWLSAALSELAEEREIRAVDVAGLPWSEIDFPYDLDRARKRVWPAIRTTIQRRRWPWRVGQAALGLASVALLALMINTIWFAPESFSWESIEIPQLEAVRILAGEENERWWRLDAGDAAELWLTGPASLRVKSRLLLDESPGNVPYALQVEVNGAPLRWKNQLGKPSNRWRYGGTKVAKRRDMTLDLPEGPQHLRLRLVSLDGDSCLIRVDQREPETIED